MSSPFHPGEQALQARVGLREKIERAGRHMIRDSMLDQHRAFFASLPLVFVGSLDHARRPWASMLCGEPGFMASPDPTLLRVAAAPEPGDPLARNLGVGAPVGLLGMEFQTRRRNRLTRANPCPLSHLTNRSTVFSLQKQLSAYHWAEAKGWRYPFAW